MSCPPHGTERRHHERTPLAVDLFYRIQHPPEVKIKFGDHTETAYMVDISEGGIGFACASSVPLNTEIDLTFYLDSKKRGTIKIQAAGLIRFCSYVSDRQVYRIGLAFTLINDDDEKLIKEYIKNLRDPDIKAEKEPGE